MFKFGLVLGLVRVGFVLGLWSGFRAILQLFQTLNSVKDSNCMMLF